MKKIILSVVFVFYAMYLMAQDDAVLQLLVAQKQYEKAKDEVDKMVANPKLKDKDKPTAYLWTMLVYSNIYTDSALTNKYPGADATALDAFYKYQALDPELKKMKEQHFEGGLGNIYNGYLTSGNNYFKNKQWDSAFKYFSTASRLGDVLIANKLTQSQGDTIILAYTGYAAQNAKMIDSAVVYYSKLADLKVADTAYVDIYKVLIENSVNKKDDAAFAKYLALAKELYPNESAVWSQYEMSKLTANASLTDLLQKYQQDAAAGGMSEDKLITYAEALATTDKTQLDPLDSMQQVTIKLAAADAFAKASELNATNGLYFFNTGVIYYSLYGTLDDRYAAYRGETAALKAKRAEITKQEAAYADTASQWLEKAYTILKAKQDRARPETASLNRTVDYLANIYYWKRDQTKTNGNTKDYDTFDALYKKYDAEHNTYQ